MVAKEGDAINCHNAEEIGRSIQEEIDCRCLTDATIKASKKIKILLSMTKGIEVGNQIIHVDPLILFMRLIHELKPLMKITKKGLEMLIKLLKRSQRILTLLSTEVYFYI